MARTFRRIAAVRREPADTTVAELRRNPEPEAKPPEKAAEGAAATEPKKTTRRKRAPKKSA